MITFQAEVLCVEMDESGMRMIALHCAEFDKVLVVTHRFENGDLLISADDLLSIADRAGVAAADMLVMACHPGINRDENGWFASSTGEWYPCPIEGDWSVESVIGFDDGRNSNVSPESLVTGSVYSVSYMDRYEGEQVYAELRG